MPSLESPSSLEQGSGRTGPREAAAAETLRTRRRDFGLGRAATTRPASALFRRRKTSTLKISPRENSRIAVRRLFAPHPRGKVLPEVRKKRQTFLWVQGANPRALPCRPFLCPGRLLRKWRGSWAPGGCKARRGQEPWDSTRRDSCCWVLHSYGPGGAGQAAGAVFPSRVWRALRPRGPGRTGYVRGGPERCAGSARLGRSARTWPGQPPLMGLLLCPP